MLTNGGRFMDATKLLHIIPLKCYTQHLGNQWGMAIVNKTFSKAQINCTLCKQVNQAKMVFTHVLSVLKKTNIRSALDFP